MKKFQIALLVVLTITGVLLSVFLYKHYKRERIDILNIATLSTGVIAIVALFINLSQYFINKDKKLFETGEFRVEKHYQPKVDRIEKLKLLITFNVHLTDKGRGYKLSGESLHSLQHTFIQYLELVYKGDIPIPLIYSVPETERTDKVYVEFINTPQIVS